MSRSDEVIAREPPPENGRTSRPAVGNGNVSASASAEEVAVAAAAAAGEVPIPWRTSRRLQEATFKSLQERDSGHKPSSSNVKKEKESSSSPSPVAICSRSLRRQHLPSSEPSATEQRETKNNISAQLNGSGRKRRRRVHFGDPLFIYIEEQKQNPPSASSTTTTTSITPAASSKLLSTRKSQTQSQSGQIVPAARQKQPISCFDLLCNHVGKKGWRCYRASLEGEAFCSNHMNRATSLARISVCT